MLFIVVGIKERELSPASFAEFDHSECPWHILSWNI